MALKLIAIDESGSGHTKEVEITKALLESILGPIGGGGVAYRWVTEVIEASKMWTPPAGIKDNAVYVTGCGGGAGGNIGAASDSGAGGAAGDYAYRRRVTLPNLNPVSVVVGLGGSAGDSGSNGGSGGTTSFGSFVSIPGGQSYSFPILLGTMVTSQAMVGASNPLGHGAMQRPGTGYGWGGCGGIGATWSYPGGKGVCIVEYEIVSN